MHVRAAELSDAPGLAEIHVRSWQMAYAGLLPQSLLDSLDPVQRSTGWEVTLRASDVPSQVTLVAEDDGGRLAGFVHLCPARDGPVGAAGEVAALYVAPAYWRTGVGRRLMEAAVSQLTDAGFRYAILWVLDRNERAIRFYEATGWSVDGAAKEVKVSGHPVTEVRMTRRLS